MPSIIPNVGIEVILGTILSGNVAPTLRVEAITDLPDAIDALGDDLTYADLNIGTGYVNGDSIPLVQANWVVPTGANAGQAATHPRVEFEGDTGGGSAITGYIVVDQNDVVWVLETNPEVEVDDTPKAMPAGARYQVDPTLGGT